MCFLAASPCGRARSRGGGSEFDCTRVSGLLGGVLRLRAMMEDRTRGANRWKRPLWANPAIGIVPRRSEPVCHRRPLGAAPARGVSLGACSSSRRRGFLSASTIAALTQRTTIDPPCQRFHVLRVPCDAAVQGGRRACSVPVAPGRRCGGSLRPASARELSRAPSDDVGIGARDGSHHLLSTFGR